MTPDCPTCVPSSADVLARGVRDTGTKNRGVTSDGIAAKRTPFGVMSSVLLGRSHRSTTYSDAAYYYRTSSVVCLSSVGLPVCHDREPCKTAEPIEMPFRLWIRVGPRNRVVDWSPDPNGKGQFDGKRAAHCKVLGLYRPCAAAMQPFVKLLWPLVL